MSQKGLPSILSYSYIYYALKNLISMLGRLNILSLSVQKSDYVQIIEIYLVSSF